MRKTYIIIAGILGCCVAFAPAFAQDIKDNVSAYQSINGSMYLQPLADTFGANLNSGFFHTAEIKETGFHLYFGVKVMGAPIPDEQKTFIAKPENGFDPPPNTKLPTVFGSEENVYIDGQERPGGAWDTKILPIAVPQLTVGSSMGTELTMRWIEFKVDDNIGYIRLIGVGARHSISQYIPDCLVDITIGYLGQSFKVGDIVEANASYMGLQASYSYSVLCFYGGIGYERARLEISYTYEENGEDYDIRFHLSAKNAVRFTIGLALDLPALKIHADYNLASQQVFCAGLGFGF